MFFPIISFSFQYSPNLLIILLCKVCSVSLMILIALSCASLEIEPSDLQNSRCKHSASWSNVVIIPVWYSCFLPNNSSFWLSQYSELMDFADTAILDLY